MSGRFPVVGERCVSAIGSPAPGRLGLGFARLGRLGPGLAGLGRITRHGVVSVSAETGRTGKDAPFHVPLTIQEHGSNRAGIDTQLAQLGRESFGAVVFLVGAVAFLVGAVAFLVGAVAFRLRTFRIDRKQDSLVVIPAEPGSHLVSIVSMPDAQRNSQRSDGIVPVAVEPEPLILSRSGAGRPPARPWRR